MQCEKSFCQLFQCRTQFWQRLARVNAVQGLRSVGADGNDRVFLAAHAYQQGEQLRADIGHVHRNRRQQFVRRGPQAAHQSAERSCARRLVLNLDVSHLPETPAPARGQQDRVSGASQRVSSFASRSR